MLPFELWYPLTPAPSEKLVDATHGGRAHRKAQPQQQPAPLDEQHLFCRSPAFPFASGLHSLIQSPDRCDQQNDAFFKSLEVVRNFTIKRGDAS